MFRRLFQRFRKKGPCSKSLNLRSQMVLHRASKKLKLDDNQRFLLIELIKKLNHIKTGFRDTLFDTKKTFFDLLDADLVNRETVRDILQTGLFAIERNAEASMIAFTDFYDTLTGEQRLQLNNSLHFASKWQYHTRCPG